MGSDICNPTIAACYCRWPSYPNLKSFLRPFCFASKDGSLVEGPPQVTNRNELNQMTRLPIDRALSSLNTNGQGHHIAVPKTFVPTAVGVGTRVGHANLHSSLRPRLEARAAVQTEDVRYANPFDLTCFQSL